MTSIYTQTIKALIISLVITVGIGLSAFSIVTESKESTNFQAQTSVTSDGKNQVFQPKSQFEKKLHRDLSMLMPWHKQFNPRFLSSVLTDNSKKQGGRHDN